MNASELKQLGVPQGDAVRYGIGFVTGYIQAGLDPANLQSEVTAIIASPETHASDPSRGAFAKSLLAKDQLRKTPASWRLWGEGLDAEAIRQLTRACELPISVAGALMPDAHIGYGLPIGGVLATENAVIPFAVGTDIACRVKMTVLDLPVADLTYREEALIRAIESETRFGIGAKFATRRSHDVMDADWSVSPVTKQNKDRAQAQLGTSGSGNHFVEFGTFTASEAIGDLAPGTYVALLSHSGSRGTGGAVCDYYSKLAIGQRRNLPPEYQKLSWLSLDSQEGQEYWAAMELMGQYASANHALIHQHVARHLGLEVLLDVENHHNFAWKEKHVLEGVEREVIVHRKGATPAGAGVLGLIPGSMAAPGFLVRGKGHPESLRSASHGAGRAMSRTKATQTLDWSTTNRMLDQQQVKLISAGLDEAPLAYKDIHAVMAAQSDLVDTIGRFDPRLVKMAPVGERAED
ncbi:MAG TPA: RtcB family protein [Candidatus Limnocylindria bacterium]|jgi:tRNA-splicing ligase RtcB|nr:RtcB family protein [Candidatus Limnocylindria bacterium]